MNKLTTIIALDACSGGAVASSDLLADSPTWPYVLAFAERMESKLAKNRHKGDRNGWINCNTDELSHRIWDEMQELEDALDSVRHKENIAASEREAIANEAADVANFAMMIADIYTGAKSVGNTREVSSLHSLVRSTSLENKIAAAVAHRGCCGTEHDPAQGKLHGYCVVCGVPWPCDTAAQFLSATNQTAK